MYTVLILFTFLGLTVLLQWISKIEFYKMREGKEKLVAEVVEYIDQKSPMRNDFTMIPYPFVRTIPDTTPGRLVKLKYTRSPIKPFRIGQQVEVFWYGGVLYYWNAYDKGILKYLPSKGLF